MLPKVVIKDRGEEEWTDVWQYSIPDFLCILNYYSYVRCIIALAHLRLKVINYGFHMHAEVV